MAAKIQNSNIVHNDATMGAGIGVNGGNIFIFNSSVSKR